MASPKRATRRDVFARVAEQRRDAIRQRIEAHAQRRLLAPDAFDQAVGECGAFMSGVSSVHAHNLRNRKRAPQIVRFLAVIVGREAAARACLARRSVRRAAGARSMEGTPCRCRPRRADSATVTPITCAIGVERWPAAHARERAAHARGAAKLGPGEHRFVDVVAPARDQAFRGRSSRE